MHGDISTCKSDASFDNTSDDKWQILFYNFENRGDVEDVRKENAG